MAEDLITVSWNGRDLVEGLEQFKDTVARGVVRSSIRRIGNAVRDVIAAAAPHRTGRLEGNIAVSTQTAATRGIVKARVIVRTEGHAGDPRNAFYWRFVNFGHRTRPSRRGGVQHEVPGSHFVEASAASAQSFISDQFFNDLAAAVDRTFTRT